MYELLYTSVSPKGLSKAELDNILQTARTNNSDLDITGMLVYHDREIMQILEGEEKAVKALYQSIVKDPRHLRVETFYQGTIKQRSFSNWSMAFKLLEDAEMMDLTVKLDAVDEGGGPINTIANTANRGKKAFMQLRDTL